jgi:hypothetical protein
VLCQHGLQFFADRPAALREIRRVLDREGRLAVSVWQSIDQLPLFQALTAAEARHLETIGITPDPVFLPCALGDAAELRGLLEQAGFLAVEITEGRIDAVFPDPENFVRKMEHAYVAVVPELASDPQATDAFVAAVSRDVKGFLDEHRRGDTLVFPLKVHLATAHM